MNEEYIQEIEDRINLYSVLNEQADLIDNALTGLINIFSDRGLVGAFTDIITKARAAKQYSSDPIAQRIFNIAARAEKSNDIDNLTKAVSRIEHYIDNYSYNFRKLINNPDIIRQVAGRDSGYAWHPEHVIGTPTETFGKVAFAGLTAYEQFPQPYEFVDSVIQASEALVYAALVIISNLSPKAARNKNFSNKLVKKLENFLVALYNLEKKSFRIRATFKRRQDRGYEFNLSELIERVNEGTNNGIKLIIDFIKAAKSGMLQSQVVKQEKEKDNSSTDSTTAFLAAEPKNRDTKMKKNKDKYNIDLSDFEININEVVESVIQRLIEIDELEEASGVGSIAGYSLPLGTSNQKDPDKEMKDTVEKSGYKELVPDPDSEASNISPQYKDSFKKGSDFYFKGRKSDAK